MLEDLEELVNRESPSQDLAAVARCAAAVDEQVSRVVGSRAERLEVDGRVHLRWRFGQPRVVLLGHLDTVWPLGTLRRWPFRVDGDVISGPGVFDMKAGIVQLASALEGLDDLDGVTVVITSDEELGSPTSAGIVEDSARGARAALVLEPSADGALKIARKGVAAYRLRVQGQAAHAGLDRDRGVNATVEVAHQILRIDALTDAAEGTAVTPTLLQAGTTSNTIPAEAELLVDVRTASVVGLERVSESMSRLAPVTEGATVQAELLGSRPPLTERHSGALFELAHTEAVGIGITDLRGVAVGGGSDGNITANAGVPTLDGLGAVGGNAHAEGEWASAAAMGERADLVAAVIRRLMAG